MTGRWKGKADVRKGGSYKDFSETAKGCCFRAPFSEHSLVGEEDDEGGKERHHRDCVGADVHIEASDDAFGHAARRVVAPLLPQAVLAHAGEPSATSCALFGGQL